MSEDKTDTVASADAATEGAAADAATAAPADPPAPETSPLDEARAEGKKLRDQLMRTAADFDNFRKRSRRENDDAYKRGREELLRELLPVFDNLERAAQSAEQATEAKSVADGVRIVLRQFTDTLGRAGIQRLVTVGQAFDPTHHEAIQQLETADHPPGTVVAEVQAGYASGERLVRAALVVVAKPKSAAAEPVAAPASEAEPAAEPAASAKVGASVPPPASTPAGGDDAS